MPDLFKIKELFLRQVLIHDFFYQANSDSPVPSRSTPDPSPPVPSTSSETEKQDLVCHEVRRYVNAGTNCFTVVERVYFLHLIRAFSQSEWCSE